MASGTNGASNSSGQQALDRFAQMMIERMERMKGSDWEKGWMDILNKLTPYGLFKLTPIDNL